MYSGINNRVRDKEPQSCYVAVQNKGQTWHLFNAARMPLGRMAEHIALFIRGKHKPTYTKQRADLGDVCVVVNAANTHMTGRKKFYQMYRHHTGYPSGLKEISMIHLMEKDPEKLIYLSVKGMLPKNNLREEILSKYLIVHGGPYHPHLAQKLPQFTEPEPKDFNKEFNFEMSSIADPDQYKIVFESDPKAMAEDEQFGKHIRDIDEEMSRPGHLTEKTHTDPKINKYMASYARGSYKRFRKYKNLKK